MCHQETPSWTAGPAGACVANASSARGAKRPSAGRVAAVSSRVSSATVAVASAGARASSLEFRSAAAAVTRSTIMTTSMRHGASRAAGTTTPDAAPGAVRAASTSRTPLRASRRTASARATVVVASRSGACAGAAWSVGAGALLEDIMPMSSRVTRPKNIVHGDIVSPIHRERIFMGISANTFNTCQCAHRCSVLSAPWITFRTFI